MDDPIGVTLVCNCGGIVLRLCNDEAYYWLTERKTIVFRGHCNRCNQVVQVERDLETLLLICPDKDGAKWH